MARGLMPSAAEKLERDERDQAPFAFRERAALARPSAMAYAPDAILIEASPRCDLWHRARCDVELLCYGLIEHEVTYSAAVTAPVAQRVACAARERATHQHRMR
jgi:hypothetical protein